MRWLLQVGTALSQLLNTLLWGWADESLSSRSWRMKDRRSRWRWMRFGIDSILGANHCQDAYISERKRTQSPPELRGPV